MKRLIAILIIFSIALCLYLLCKPAALSTADLASPSQEVRDAAAKILRAKAKPTSKLKWMLRTVFIRAGETQTNIFDLLHTYNLSVQPEAGMGGLGEYCEYRLDDYWLLGCEFNNNDDQRFILERWKLVSRWRAIAVWPSTNFSGVWINYYANGRKLMESHYKDGLLCGERISFESQGSTNAVEHFDHGKLNGSLTFYFPSGRVRMQCQYSNNVQVGIKVRFNENGTTNFIKDYSKP
ncbi:MAG: hypothetical protein WDN00_16360 [Limisphaerales bacterium]